MNDVTEITLLRPMPHLMDSPQTPTYHYAGLLGNFHAWE